MSSEYECPILKRVIDDGYCYEITTAAYGIVKMSMLEDKIDRDVALEYCEKCPYNQYND